MTARIDGHRIWWLLFVPAVMLLAGCLIVGAPALARVSPHSAASLAMPATPRIVCGSLTFASPVTYTANIRPRSSTTGYLNGDNNLDLVVTDYSANSVSVFLGNADGTFQSGASYTVGVNPVSAAVDDFNGDTVPDLAVSNYESANVSILLGNGNGTFQPAMNYSSNIGPYGVAVGDFDENTHADVATSNVNFGTINVMLGNGNGTLQSPVTYQAQVRPHIVAAGHFNADNHLDLVATDYNTARVNVLLGNGNGTFQSAVPYTMTGSPDYVMVTDLNNDTKDDLVLSHYATSNNIGVSLGNGDGSFGPETTYSTGGDNPTFASVGDFNGDGIPDLVSPGYASDNVSILLGNGNGTFQSPESFSVASGSSPVSVLAGDFNHDGRVDMFTANENTNDISVFLNTCPAQTTPTPTPIGTATPSPSATAPACQPWQLVQSPNEGTSDNRLFAVSAAASDDIWAAGYYVTTDFYERTLIEHWDGNSWTVVPSPDPGTANDVLFGVAALSANNAWAVGWYANTNIQQPLVLHWGGSNWTDASPSLARPRVVLEGISALAQNDIWAVGQSCDSPMCNRHITATLHYDGSAWTVVDSPNPATYDNVFYGVQAVSSSDVWAVGEACTGNGCETIQTLVERWDGMTWTVIQSPSPSPVANVLFGVDAQAGEAWAVGYKCPTSACAPTESLTLHWDGTNWNEVTSPNPGTADTHLDAVTMAAANDAWAGGSESNDGNIYGNLMLHWDGSSWTTVSVTNPGSANNDLFGLTRLSPSDIWAVGDFDSGSGLRTQTQHYTGACASPTATATAPPGATATASATVAAATRTATATATTAATAPPTATATTAPSSTAVLPTSTQGLPTASPTSCALQFTDVPPGSTFYPYVHCLACLGIINGYPDGTFKPNANVTRGQLSKIVANSAGFNDMPTGQQFQDVPVGSTFYVYIYRLVHRGYINGYPCGGANEPCVPPANLPYFRPNANATRGQISKIDANAAGFNDTPSGQQFEDVGVGSAFYTYTYRLVSRGVMSGYPCGGAGEPCVPPANLPYFRPNNNATRGQTSKIVSNTFFPDCNMPR